MRTVAFYLPQFHRIPENDQWWGEGFTEWTNVRRAEPQFEGHLQPRVPTTLGEYDLTSPAVHVQQSAMARAAGIDAFCMYFYWFGGRRLLERPLELWRQDEGLLPYCLSWANESWTRRWDGKDREVLMHQDYAEGFVDSLYEDLLPHFEAPHYLRVNRRPVLVIHRVDLLPDARSITERLRLLANESGLAGLYLIAAETKPGITPEAFGCDAIAEFPPVGTNTLATAYLRPLKGVAPSFRGRLMSYERLARRFEMRPSVDHIRHPGVAPGWDNTARRQTKATIYVGHTPERFSRWLETARSRERRARAESGLVFINAWNEWAEGAYLEPDASVGNRALGAVRARSLSAPASGNAPVQHGIFWSAPQLRSLTLSLFGSILAHYRVFRARMSSRFSRRER